MDESERAAYDAAMEENVLLKVVLDDLKAAGSAPGGNSRRRCVAARREIEAGDRPAPDPHTRVSGVAQELLRVPPRQAGGR